MLGDWTCLAGSMTVLKSERSAGAQDEGSDRTMPSNTPCAQKNAFVHCSRESDTVNRLNSLSCQGRPWARTAGRPDCVEGFEAGLRALDAYRCNLSSANTFQDADCGVTLGEQAILHFRGIQSSQINLQMCQYARAKETDRQCSNATTEPLDSAFGSLYTASRFR